MHASVPVGPIRDHVLKLIDREELTWEELGIRLGYAHPKNTAAIRRRLGVGPEQGRAQTHMTYSTAVRIVRAVGADPVDFDV